MILVALGGAGMMLVALIVVVILMGLMEIAAFKQDVRQIRALARDDEPESPPRLTAGGPTTPTGVA